jgi:hypothetical protein
MRRPLTATATPSNGGKGISGFVLASGAAGGATEINTANQKTIGAYQFVQPGIATTVPGAVTGAQSTRNGTSAAGSAGS